MNRCNAERSLRERWVIWALLFPLVAGCGGTVDVGANAAPELTSDGTPATEATPETARIRTLQVVSAAVGEPYEMVVSNGYLYVQVLIRGTDQALYRCRKDDCGPTWTKVRSPGVGRGFGELAIVDERLAFVAYTGTHAFFGTCALPHCDNERSAVSDLAFQSPWNAFFSAGEVVWHIQEDQAVYRCDLPDCSQGPVSVATGVTHAPSRYVASQQFIYWDDGLWHRARRDGSGQSETFSPGVELSPVNEVEASADRSIPQFQAIGIHSETLYATIWDPSCTGDSDCGRTIVRWPMQANGTRETVLEQSIGYDSIHLFAGELVWTNYGSRGKTALRQLWSCRVEACAETKRLVYEEPFDTVTHRDSHLVADDRYLYWLSGTQNSHTYDRILRVRLLPAPP